MKFLTSSLVLLLLLVLLSRNAAQAQKGGDWKILFDGKSTDAWRGYKRDGFPEKGWVVENGALKTVAGDGSGGTSDLITKDKYKNFELELEWRVSPGGNSGFFYNVAETDGPAWHTGPEVQILDDERHPDAKLGKNGNRKAGSLYDLIPASPGKTLRPVGEFNKVRLIVNNNRVQHFLNGKKVVEYTLGSPEMKKLIAESKFSGFPRFAQEPEGYIALQHHGEEVWFRNIRVRALPAK